MFDYLSKQYIFKDSSGTLWNFYLDARQGFCYSQLSKKGSWGEGTSLQKNILPGFFVDLDPEDCFHILFQDLQGNIHYGRLDKDFTVLPVLSGKTSTPYNKQLSLVPAKNNIQLFYVLQYKDNFLLTQQAISEGKVGSPRVVDYILNMTRPYSVLQDPQGGIYLFYQASDGRYLQIGCKKAVSPWKQWSEFTSVSRWDGHCEYPCTLMDASGVLHITYQRQSQRQQELIYQQKIPDKNLWTKEVVIHSSAYSFENAFLVTTGDTLVIFWVREDIIFSSSSSDDGTTWSKPLRYNFPAARQLLCMSYKTNAAFETGKINAGTIPGSYLNGLKLAFLTDPQTSAPNLTAEDFRTFIVDGLKMLKGSVEELKDVQTRTLDDITRLTGLQQTQERDKVKASVRVEMLEGELNRLKQELSQLRQSLAAMNDAKRNAEAEEKVRIEMDTAESE